MKQHRITQAGPLHSPDGSLTEPGWATEPLLQYDRTKVRAPRWRIKEWDYYCVLGQGYGAAFTVADNGYMGFAAVTIFDFTAATETSQAVMTAFPLGKLALPADSESGDVHFTHKGLQLHFQKLKDRRVLEVDCPNLGNAGSLNGRLELQQPADQESMVIATPFAKNRKAFYYNRKINCLPASGSLQFADRVLDFDPGQDSGVLDWGRGVWTYSNTWYWGSASGHINGKRFGFNIGYGFGDTSRATENMLFYDGRAHKLEHVNFHLPHDDYLKPWKFTSSDGRFELDFEPILDRASNDNFLIIKSVQHQVFGRFSGTVVLSDGKELAVRDLLGFAEKVENRW